MKILLVNPPVVRYDNEFKNIETATSARNILDKLKKPLGNGFYNFFKKIFFNKEFRYGVRAGSRWPWTTNHPLTSPHFPFFMAYSAALLKQNGFEINIIDAIADKTVSYNKFFKQVKAQKADIVIVECSTPTIDIDLWVAENISKFTDVALAGPHLTGKITPELKAQNPHIKYFLKGEYILSSLKMAQTLKEGIYEGEVVKDLNLIPFPYRDYKNAEKYFDPSMPTAQPQLQIYGSKGCPFKCKFCMWPQTMYKGNVSLRDPKLIAQEIRENVEKHGYKSILFDDDTFNIGNERISELCDYLKEIGLPWTMMGRLDCSPDWIYDKMVDCGCVGMRFGVESFNLDVLKSINKGLERVDFQKTLAYISQKHPQLDIHLTMMKNMPGQTDEIHQEDMRILNELGYSVENTHRSYQLASCVPFPGTKLYEEMVEKQGEDAMNDFSKYDGGKDTIMTDMEGK